MHSLRLRFEVGNNCTQRYSVISHQQRTTRTLLGSVCALAVALALGSAPATARDNSGTRHRVKKEAEHSKEPFGNIRKGPLQIFISINQQKLHLYSDGAHVEDTLVATGVPGHSTPMGVFSVIEKDRFHHSNIYSNAPMPFMQRITWSGVAMHEGTGVGHVASHGCIRMPRDFAARLWVLTRLGVRVIIARNELKPTDFADTHLFVHKDAPASVPAAALPTELLKTAQAIDNTTKTDAVDAPLPAASTPQSDPAPASAVPAEPATSSHGMLDAIKPVAIGVAIGLDTVAPAKNAAAPTSSGAAVASEPVKPDPIAVVPPHAPAAADANLPAPAPAVAAAPVQAAAPTPAPAVAAAPIQAAAPAPAPAAVPAQSAAPAKSVDMGAPLNVGAPINTGSIVKADAVQTDAVAPDATDVEPVPLPIPKPERLLKAEASKSAPIAVFISRRNSKIYVRQNFEPVFSAPVVIDHPEQPLGTHVFTAMEYLDGGSTFRWNVVSLPADPPKAARNSDREKRSERSARERRNEARDAEPQPPETPAQALARIEIPPDVIEQISELMVPGSSLIVSDQGLGEETGEGTDFIVVTR
jgi:hypothetical protein